MAPSPAPLRILTIGHSTRTLETLLQLLVTHGVELLVDVRTVPRSRRHPQFNRETLPEALAAHGIAYLHLKALGGWRRPRPDSVNTGWRSAGFRGYADYMQTEPFRAALDELCALARQHRAAVMCAEAVPWRCHRWLISDALVVRGVQVEHIVSLGPTQPHRLTSFARVEGNHIVYEGPPALPLG
jgi:uncharacterized protein (DUF488 family)